MLRILSAKSRERSLKEGDIIKAFSEDKLSPTLFEQVIKASIVSKDERYWIKNLVPQAPEDLALAQVPPPLLIGQKDKTSFSPIYIRK